MNNDHNVRFFSFFAVNKNDTSLAKQNTALVFDSCSIFLGLGNVICYQPQTIQYYKITCVLPHDNSAKQYGQLQAIDSSTLIVLVEACSYYIVIALGC